MTEWAQGHESLLGRPKDVLRKSMSVQSMAFGCLMYLERLEDMRHSKAINWMDMDFLKTFKMLLKIF